MKMSCKESKTENTRGHPRELLRHLGMVVEQPEEARMGADVRMMDQLIIVMAMTTGLTDHAVVKEKRM